MYEPLPSKREFAVELVLLMPSMSPLVADETLSWPTTTESVFVPDEDL